jgi:pimeloyl-ACP methyl ester carboxylesterase
MTTRSATTVVLIHGMYMNVSSWEAWRDRAAAQGLTAHTIEWPGHEGVPAELRANPPQELRTLSFGPLVDHHEAQIRELGAEEAVLIGHSIGGLLVQALLARGIGRAGVAISPAPPAGVLSLRPDFLRANAPHTNVFLKSRPLNQSPRRFHYTFANSASRAESDAYWNEFCTPESRAVPLSTTGREGRVDAAAVTQPLLVFGGTNDHLIPASLARKIASRYATAEYRELPGADHFVCNEPGWETLADECFEWAKEHAGASS